MTGIALATGDNGDGTANPGGTNADTNVSDPANGNGNPGDGTGGGGIKVGSSYPAGGGTDSNTPWYASLTDEGAKALAESKKWATIDDAMKSYKELETAFSGKLEALAPKTAAEYNFKKPENLPTGANYNDTFAGTFKTWAHELKLTNDQAAHIHDKFMEFASAEMTTAAKAHQTALSDAIVSSEKTLKKEWGAPESAVFTQNIELARRAMANLGIADDMKAAGVITDVGGVPTVTNAKMLMALAKVGSAMFKEDSTFGKSATDASNPFDPATLNLKAQGELFTSDPARAAMWIDQLPPEHKAQYASLRAKLKAKGH